MNGEEKENPSCQETGRDVRRKSVLALACSLCFLLALDAGLLIMLALANLLNDACAGALTLKTLQSALQRFVLADAYLGHCYPSSRSSRLDISRLRRTDGEPYYYYIAFHTLRQWINGIFSKKFTIIQQTIVCMSASDHERV